MASPRSARRLELHVLGAAAPLGRDPGDDLVWIHDVAGLAVHAIAGVDLQAAPAPFLRYHLVDRRGAEALARVGELLGAAGLADARVGDLQVGGLVLLMTGAGVEDVAQPVERERAVGPEAVV